jgi:hypothetical protein
MKNLPLDGLNPATRLVPLTRVRPKGSHWRERQMMRAIVIGGSLGGLTRNSGSPRPGLGRGRPGTQSESVGGGRDRYRRAPDDGRYLVERAGKWIGDIFVPAHSLRYLGADGSIADEQPCAYRFASYFELYRGLLDAFARSATTWRVSSRTWITERTPRLFR